MRQYYEVTFSGPGIAGLLGKRTLLPEGWITMFKFETVVLLLSLTWITSANGQQQNYGTDCAKLSALGWDAESKTPPNTAAAERFYKQADECIKNQTKNGTVCNNADSDFNKAMTDFSSACGDANLGGDCATEVLKCKKTRRQRYVSDGESRDPNRPYDVKGVAKQCPADAGRDIDKLEKEAKDYKEKVQKLENELPKLRDEVNTKKSKLNEKQQDLQKEMSEEQKKLTEDLQKISEDQDGQRKAITDQVTGISAQIAKAQDALSQVSVTRMEGQLKLKQAKVQADLNCHAQASAQMAKMQNDVMDAAQKGNFNIGGFSKAMSRVGLTDRQHWQRLAQKYYQWCLDSKPTKDTKEGANDGYRLLLAQSKQTEISINKQIEQLKKQQQQLVGGACTGQAQTMPDGSDGGEPSMCQVVRKAIEKANNLKQAFVQKQSDAKQKYMQLAQEGQDQMQTLQQNYYDKMTELNNEKTRLDNVQKYLQAKYDRSGGSSNTDGKGVGKALALMTSVKAAADQVLACQDERKTEAANKVPPQNPPPCGKCDVAQQFIDQIKDNEAAPGYVHDEAASAPLGRSDSALDNTGSEQFSDSPAAPNSGTGRSRR